ncbi:MAG: ATP-dependent DNA helicase RecG [Clostridiales bacterium]|nr:ATP-dependent DNA helicase RecG [Clostridiales bacterium]
MEVLKKSIQYVKGVGPKRLTLLNRLNIFNIEDMIYHFPRDYDNRSHYKNIKDLQIGDKTTIRGVISGNSQYIRINKNRNIVKYLVRDNTGFITITFFNQPYMRNKFKPNDKIILNGQVKGSSYGLEIINPAYEIIPNLEYKTKLDSINPIYPSTEGFSQGQLIKIQQNVLDMVKNKIIDYMPENIKKENKLCDLNFALKNIHFPDSVQALRVAKYRLVFDEFFLLQLALMQFKNQIINNKNTVPLKSNEGVDLLIDSLPFKLTAAQIKVLQEIMQDMEKATPMNRLVQGDVGSGKTIIAIIALYKAVINGCQGALMAPTEILAEQHYISLTKILRPMGIKIGLLTGSLSKKEKEEISQGIKDGKVQIVVGTHALIQETVHFASLGLVVTDEQHRFGVRQRAILADKGNNPHVLVMTATPIPRTLALILYGDLDISIIDELPPGRKSIKTYGLTLDKRNQAYDFAKKELEQGRQVYIVCPLVEESENLDVSAAIDIRDELATTYFSDYEVGLLHGKMNPKEKESIMKKFLKNEIHVLVSTTVIEVGVNVPNATIMIIENAERFGLAQLHQLRGRVGRGHSQSFCILLHNNKSETAKERIKIMEETTDGFVISEKDLQIRGPGEFFGIRQHGLPDFKIANVFRHMKILKRAQNQVEILLKEDPNLSLEKYPLLKSKIQEKYGYFQGI